MANKIPREWLDEEVTISREELGRIMTNEIREVIKATAVTTQDKEFTLFIKGLFELFAASVGTEVFKKATDTAKEEYER